MPKPPPQHGKRRREGALEDRRGGRPSTKRLKTDITSWTTPPTPRYPWLTLIQSESDVGIEHVLALCGLGPLARTSLCPNKFQHHQPQQPQPQRAWAGADSKGDGDDVLEASSSGDNDDNDDANDDDEGDHQDETTITITHNCSKVNCKNNPYCLNYLGQERWENEGQSQSLFSVSVQTASGRQTIS